jgi:preprotein translocase subunit SecY
MLSALRNLFKIEDLKRKILITLLLLVVYRIGCFIPTPGINAKALAEFFERIGRTQGGTIFGILNMFSGGALERLTIFALGIEMGLALYVLLEAGFQLFEPRGIVRFGWG